METSSLRRLQLPTTPHVLLSTRCTRCGSATVVSVRARVRARVCVRVRVCVRACVRACLRA
jgi:hypothetical protein